MERFIEKLEKLEIGEYIYYDKNCYIVKESKIFYVIHNNLRTVGYTNLASMYQILWLFGYED